MGFDEIYFVDDTFNSDVDWLKDFISGVKDKDILWSCRARIVGIDEPLMRSLKESNCVRMHFGVETPNSEALKIFNKGITVEEVKNVFILSRKYNIKTVGYFLIGSPNETSKKDILNTIDFALSLDPNYAMFNILTIYPKTELYGLALEKGVVNKSLWSQFIENPYRDFKLPFWQEYFDREQLYSFLTKAYVKFYCRPKGIISAIRTLTK